MKICKCGHEKEMHDHLGFCLSNSFHNDDGCDCINVDLASNKGKAFWESHPPDKIKIKGINYGNSMEENPKDHKMF